MPEAVMVIAQRVFRDEEYAEPKRVLESRGVRVTTASIAAGECIGKLGMTAVANVALHDISANPWDAAIFIGGGGASVFFDDPDAHRLARLTLERGGVVAAICIAPSTLAHAGLLEGVSATAFASQEADLRSHGAMWSDAPVVRDGMIVTANGPPSCSASRIRSGQKRGTRMQFLRCRICGETYLGPAAPERCPFCGASERYFVEPGNFTSSENRVQLTEIERRDLEQAIQIERSNARFYAGMAMLNGSEALASGYKRLSRVEAEHCSLFCKLADLVKPDDLGVPEATPPTWGEAITESIERETRAAEFYAEVVGRATNERVREVFSAVAEVEHDHLVLDSEALRLAGC